MPATTAGTVWCASWTRGMTAAGMSSSCRGMLKVLRGRRVRLDRPERLERRGRRELLGLLDRRVRMALRGLQAPRELPVRRERRVPWEPRDRRALRELRALEGQR